MNISSKHWSSFSPIHAKFEIKPKSQNETSISNNINETNHMVLSLSLLTHTMPSKLHFPVRVNNCICQHFLSYLRFQSCSRFWIHKQDGGGVLSWQTLLHVIKVAAKQRLLNSRQVTVPTTTWLERLVSQLLDDL